ncbi:MULTISPECIES: universal stress protein [unclassified Brucella]|uniref:universal stress protein n=1 Tax=unclassified Brucella TaxID=2632610 RepID=UPI00129493F9|nr:MULTISPECIES: universal stress protein [unclassified Brucella]MRN42896.1 universal stress protein [Brucella sp. 09RB8913]MRN59160.1 universal stress protein [Brucella sp. 09RB8918]QGA57151.1 universal stress protein [Brucella sp. 2280]CAB4324870.1 UspA domain-containing protein [Brucella sp. 191011898]
MKGCPLAGSFPQWHIAAMVSRRLSREAGHRRKFLAVIDETPECGRAVAYAARRARNTNGSLVMLFVIDNSEFQQILGVGEIMRAEAEERARTALEKFAANVRAEQGIDPELIIREGRTAEELLSLVEEDQDIAILVLAAGASKEGPGPLVQSLAGRAQFPIPVTVVPAGLSDDDIDALT